MCVPEILGGFHLVSLDYDNPQTAETFCLIELEDNSSVFPLCFLAGFLLVSLVSEKPQIAEMWAKGGDGEGGLLLCMG